MSSGTAPKSSRPGTHVSGRPLPSHVVGIDDAPFDRQARARVRVVGTVYAGTRLDGVLSSTVARDGDDATRAIAAMVRRSRFAAQVQLVMLQGIAVAGFNVIDIHRLSRALGVPVLVVARRMPDLRSIQAALRGGVRGGDRKWAAIVSAGVMEPAQGLVVQRVGLSLAVAEAVIARLAIHGKLPEPLRVAHLIAGGIGRGQSRGRA